MAYFNSQNGWIQYVFGNEQDYYYLPSLMKVGFDRYLFYCLRRAGYEYIYYWKESDGKPEISYMDQWSAQYYETIRPRGFLGKILGGQESADVSGNYHVTRPIAPDQAEKIFYSITGSKKKTALVVPLQVFHQFLSQSPQRPALIRWCQEQGKSGNLLLLTASVRSEESNRIFLHPDGLFFALSEEIHQAAKPDGLGHFYEKMLRNLDERCIYLNDIPVSMLRNLVKRNEMFGARPTIPADHEIMEKVVYVLDWFYHSEIFRLDSELDLPRNRLREYQLIEKALQNQRICEQILQWVQVYGEGKDSGEFRQYLGKNYPRETTKCFITSDHFLLRKWDQVRPGGEVFEPYLRQWQYCRRMLYAMVIRGDEKEEREQLDCCIDVLRKSRSETDVRTYHHGLTAMEYLLETCYDKTEIRDNIWKFYQKIFELSEMILQYDKDLALYKEKMYASQVEIQKIFDQVDELEQRYGSGDELGEIDLLRQRAIQCDRDYVELNTSSKVLKNQRFQYEQAITAIENSIVSGRKGKKINVENTLREAMDMQQKNLQEDIGRMKILSSLSEQNARVTDLLTGEPLEESDQLEDRFRALSRQLDRLIIEDQSAKNE